MGEIKTIQYEGKSLSFDQEDAFLEGGVKEPLLGVGFVEPIGFYWTVDSNKRIWIQMGSETFSSPCLTLCLSIIRQHPQSYEKVCGFLYGEIL